MSSRIITVTVQIDGLFCGEQCPEFHKGCCCLAHMNEMEGLKVEMVSKDEAGYMRTKLCLDKFGSQ